jgi:rhodanese-related sulfurtransferase
MAEPVNVLACDLQLELIVAYEIVIRFYEERKEMKTIEATKLKALLDGNDDVLLVNTLNADSFEKTRVPGAVNIPLEGEDFLARVEEQAGGKDKPVVVYCASQQCNSSEKAAEKLENAGFTAVTDFAGGFKAWQEEATNVAECHSC